MKDSLELLDSFNVSSDAIADLQQQILVSNEAHARELTDIKDHIASVQTDKIHLRTDSKLDERTNALILGTLQKAIEPLAEVVASSLSKLEKKYEQLSAKIELGE